jgi:Uma2 family endonuclease
MIPTTKKVFTYEDYEKLPEGAPYQLITGELIMIPAPTPYHQLISWKFEMQLSHFVVQNGLGIVLDAPIDVYLAETETYQPDIIFISKDRLQLMGEKKIEGAPDLVVEILSPSTAYYDLKHKKQQYQSSGVKEYWIIDPIEKSIEVYFNSDGEFQLVCSSKHKGEVYSRLLHGFRVQLPSVF